MAQDMLKITSHWIPTKKTGENLFKARTENRVNIPQPELDDKAPFEVMAEPRGEKIFRNFLNEAAVRKYQQRVEEYVELARVKKTANRYIEAYSRSGGLLNIFNDDVSEKYDELWSQLWSENIAGVNFGSEQERQKQIREIEHIWNYTPNNLFSMLTPALVWAGGGEVEEKLIQLFLEKLEKRFANHPFANHGEVLIKSLIFLRSWQMMPLASKEFGSKSPMDLILEERNLILRKKEAILQDIAELCL